jgi:formamidopyrimidine-DNA glycosylase
MFELPEYLTLARQINETLSGKVIRQARLGNAAHKFVWYNQSQEEFEHLTCGKKIGTAWVKGRWMMIPWNLVTYW